MDKKYLNAFNLIDSIGPARMKKIIDFFPDLETAWNAGRADFEKAGIDNSILDSLIEAKEKIDPDKEIEKIQANGIEILAIDDPEYPEILKEIYNPPAALYAKGKIKKDNFAIAIVGSRKVTSYGKQASQMIARDLAASGITVISGMAIGIDTIAHTECLKAGQQTIAVLGSGLDWQSIYPAANRKLAEEIASNGAVISEYPIGSPPLRHHFPARNRIISGLSLGVVIIEATETSGALITAKYALDQNKSIYAIPGPIFSESSAGTNNLIKSGAKLITSAQEILDDLNLSMAADFIKTREIIPESEEEKIILEHLSREPIHIDKLAQLTKLNTASLNSILVIMEMKGKIRNLGAMMFVIG